MPERQYRLIGPMATPTGKNLLLGWLGLVAATPLLWLLVRAKHALLTPVGATWFCAATLLLLLSVSAAEQWLYPETAADKVRIWGWMPMRWRGGGTLIIIALSIFYVAMGGSAYVAIACGMMAIALLCVQFARDRQPPVPPLPLPDAGPGSAPDAEGPPPR